MKKYFLLSIFVLMSSLASADILVITVGNFEFSPALTNAAIGDTIKFQWIGGHHTTTCDNTNGTTLPAGASSWDAPIDVVNPTFFYQVTIAGDYHYICITHGAPMEADITVILPVELLSINALASGSNVLLNWTTNSEINNSAFDVERKRSGSSDWTKISTITGAGNSNKPVNYSFTDNNVATGRYKYRLKQIDFNGGYKYYNFSEEIIIGIPSSFNLSQNYPNPFNPATKINYDLPFDSKVSIVLFDMTGREIANLVNAFQTASSYTVSFNASTLSSGVYFYQITASANGVNSNQTFSKTLKMMLVK